MTKKAYIAAPTTRVVSLQLQSMIAVSGPSTTIDGEDGPQYDPTPADPSTAVARRRNDAWGENELEEEEY